MHARAPRRRPPCTLMRLAPLLYLLPAAQHACDGVQCAHLPRSLMRGSRACASHRPTAACAFVHMKRSLDCGQPNPSGCCQLIPAAEVVLPFIHAWAAQSINPLGARARCASLHRNQQTCPAAAHSQRFFGVAARTGTRPGAKAGGSEGNEGCPVRFGTSDDVPAPACLPGALAWDTGCS